MDHRVYFPLRRRFWSLMVFSVALVFLFSSLTIPVCASGDLGWVEAKATVPEGFQENIIICFEYIGEDAGEGYDEYATRLMAVNGYVSHFQLPVGPYRVAGAFLENSDFRYNTSLINGAAEFVVKNEEKDAAVLLEFQTVYNEEYADWTGPGLVSEGSTEGNEPQAEAEEESADPETDPEASAERESEANSEEAAEPEAQDPEKDDSTLSGFERILYGIIAAVLFLLFVAAIAALYRYYIDNR